MRWSIVLYPLTVLNYFSSLLFPKNLLLIYWLCLRCCVNISSSFYVIIWLLRFLCVFLFRIDGHHVYIACRAKVGGIIIGVPEKKNGLSAHLHLPFSCLQLSSVSVQSVCPWKTPYVFCNVTYLSVPLILCTHDLVPYWGWPSSQWSSHSSMNTYWIAFGMSGSMQLL